MSGRPGPSALGFLALLLVGAVVPGAAGRATAGSLRFLGTGADDVDRVKIALDAPNREVDVGGAFTVEFWMRALPGENPSGPCTFGNDNWITGHVVVDRDVYGPGDAGDYGISLFADGVAFGVAVGANGAGICGGGDLSDDAWHHVAAVRSATGALSLWVDGALAGSSPGPTGDLSYRDGRATSWPASDPFLVLAAEKHDAGATYPSFSGWLDELRISTIARYDAPFTPPSTAFAPDAETAALYHFDEGAGDTLRDSGGSAGDHGVLRRATPGAGPRWSSEDFAGSALAAERGPAATLALTVSPLPARSSARLVFALPRAMAVRASVHAVDGRLVREWESHVRPAGTSAIEWDLRDDRGVAVRSGPYFVRLSTALGSARSNVIVVR